MAVSTFGVTLTVLREYMPGLPETLDSTTYPTTTQLTALITRKAAIWCARAENQAGVDITSAGLATTSPSALNSSAAGQQSSFTSGITSVTADANDDETYPFVVKTGSSALVGWTDADGINFFSTYFKSLDPASCQPCEQTTQYALVGSLPIDIAGTGASTMSGGGDDDRVLLVLETDNTVTPPVRDIQAQLWESADGTTVALGGSCGNSAGTLRTNCARVGNASFALALQGAGSNTPAFAVVSRNAISMRCGTCRMIADPYTGFAQLATTNAAGSASLSLPIPNVASIRGIDFHVQWIVAEPVSPACAVFGADMTQAVRLTIQ